MKHPGSILTRLRVRVVLLLVPVAVLALGLSACQLGGKATVTLHVQNSSAQNATVASLGLPSHAAPAPQAQAQPTVQSFTPSSLEVPVVQILLADGNSGPATDLYQCDPSTDPNACKVDLAKNLNAFQDLINSTAQVAAGRYDTIRVMTCTSGQGGSATSNPIDYTADVAGQAVIGSTTYVTDPNAAGGVSVDTSGNPAPQPVALGFSGCGRDYPLASPITLQDGDTVTLSLYIDLADMAWIEDNGGSTAQTWFPSGCAQDPGSSNPPMPDGPFVCLSYPDLAAAPGDVVPTLKRYLVLDGTTDPSTVAGAPTGGLFGIYYDANGNPLSGFTRFYFDQRYQSLGYMPGTPFRSITANSDGATLSVASFGSSATGPGYFEATDFPIAGGNGSYISSDFDPGICPNGGPCPFTAKLLP